MDRLGAQRQPMKLRQPLQHQGLAPQCPRRHTADSCRPPQLDPCLLRHRHQPRPVGRGFLQLQEGCVLTRPTQPRHPVASRQDAADQRHRVLLGRNQQRRKRARHDVSCHRRCKSFDPGIDPDDQFLSKALGSVRVLLRDPAQQRTQRHPIQPGVRQPLRGQPQAVVVQPFVFSKCQPARSQPHEVLGCGLHFTIRVLCHEDVQRPARDEPGDVGIVQFDRPVRRRGTQLAGRDRELRERSRCGAGAAGLTGHGETWHRTRLRPRRAPRACLVRPRGPGRAPESGRHRGSC